MSEKERKRRPTLERTTPIRTWANVMSPGPLTDIPTAPETNTWNRVLEEHLRAGQASARLMQESLGKTSGGGDSQELVNRLVRTGSDFMNFWLEFLTRSAASMAPPSERGGPVNDRDRRPEPVAEPVPGQPFRVTVEVDSVRPVRVAVDVRPDARGSALRVDRLHPRHSTAPPLRTTRVTLGPDDVVLVQLHIDSTQPAGVYDGVIVDEVTSLPVGTISIDVRDASKTASPQSDE